jgi:hypothetical protein
MTVYTAHLKYGILDSPCSVPSLVASQYTYGRARSGATFTYHQKNPKARSSAIRSAVMLTPPDQEPFCHQLTSNTMGAQHSTAQHSTAQHSTAQRTHRSRLLRHIQRKKQVREARVVARAPVLLRDVTRVAVPPVLRRVSLNGSSVGPHHVPRRVLERVRVRTTAGVRGVGHRQGRRRWR